MAVASVAPSPSADPVPEATRPWWAVTGIVVSLVLIQVLAWTGVAVWRLSLPLAAATVAPVPAGQVTVPGTAPTLPWPTSGQAAVAIPGLGVTASSGPEGPVPVASLTKLVTAYVILHDHPLAPGQDGPSVTMTPLDAAEWSLAVVSGQANAKVTAGEVLTERQLLDGLLVHSADNLAQALAQWDAGSEAAFVTKMNAAAASLSMTSSHFVDASGYNAGSQSTASDLVKVAAADMADPTFAQIVNQTSVDLPVAGSLSSFTPLLDQPGIVGVKSGYTDAAGACDVLAQVRQVGGAPFLVLVAVVGQQHASLEHAGELALGLANAAGAGVVAEQVAGPHRVLTAAVEPHAEVGVVAARPVVVLAWPGQRVREQVTVARTRLAPGTAAGTVVGRVTYALGAQHDDVAVVTATRLPVPTWFQRLV